jgi:hypothetical protein
MRVGGAKLPLMTQTVLDREMFSEAEAARLLRVPQSTLHCGLTEASTATALTGP